MNDILIVTTWSVLNTISVLLKNSLLNDINAEELFVLQTFMILFFIGLYIVFYRPLSIFTSSYRKITKTNRLHLLLWSMTFCYLLFSIVNNILLTNKDVSKLVVMSNITFLFMITIVSSYLEHTPITLNKITALSLLCIALYLLHT